MVTIFVYGTLKRGESNHGVMERARGVYRGDGMVVGTLYTLGPYPGLVSQGEPVDGPVPGEVYEVSDAGLSLLDALEGFDPAHPEEGDYYRADTPLMAGGVVPSAHVYWMRTTRLPAHARRIPAWPPGEDV